MNRRAFFLVMLASSVVGTGGCSTEKQKSVSVDLSTKRVDHSVKEADLVFPEGYPTVKLCDPKWIGEQDEDSPGITWDSGESVTGVRDYYLAEFKKLGLETVVLTPKQMPGETYVVRIYDSKRGVAFNTAMGKQSAESAVKCFIFEQPIEEEQWRNPE
ncbi:hypothetical protein OAF71_00450 [bacterium]|nr:hypothetical protein [bacterium]